ncbi:hypothetical protein Tco_0417297 [Tanacetum coccineum]
MISSSMTNIISSTHLSSNTQMMMSSVEGVDWCVARCNMSSTLLAGFLGSYWFVVLFWNLAGGAERVEAGLLLLLTTASDFSMVHAYGTLFTATCVPRVAIARPPRALIHDLYERMGSMEIRQGAIERMSYRQSYHWDRYDGLFEHMARVYSVPLQGDYSPPGYDQQ